MRNILYIYLFIYSVSSLEIYVVQAVHFLAKVKSLWNSLRLTFDTPVLALYDTQVTLFIHTKAWELKFRNYSAPVEQVLTAN
jgi:hypothetical protein